MENNLISKVVKRLAACASVGALVLGATWGMASAGELIVYSAVDPEEVPLYKGAFEKAYPNIKGAIGRTNTIRVVDPIWLPAIPHGRALPVQLRHDGTISIIITRK